MPPAARLFKAPDANVLSFIGLDFEDVSPNFLPVECFNSLILWRSKDFILCGVVGDFLAGEGVLAEA